MIDRGPLKPKKKSSLGDFKAKGGRKYGTVNAKMVAPKRGLKPLSTLRGTKGLGATKPPVDYTLPQNKGLVKAATPERRAAIDSELAKIDTSKASRGKLMQRANLLKEKKKWGWS